MKAASPSPRTKSNPVPAPSKTGTAASSDVTADQRREMIATAAYLRAEQRGFSGGSEVEDWLAAEAEIDRTLSESSRA
jgi:hypothetical protein